jgi:hypothetical protein
VQKTLAVRVGSWDIVLGDCGLMAALQEASAILPVACSMTVRGIVEIVL